MFILPAPMPRLKPDQIPRWRLPKGVDDQPIAQENCVTDADRWRWKTRFVAGTSDCGHRSSNQNSRGEMWPAVERSLRLSIACAPSDPWAPLAAERHDVDGQNALASGILTVGARHRPGKSPED